MVDGCRLDPVRPGRGCKQEQGQAVRPTRNGNTDANIAWNERAQVGGEALDEIGSRQDYHANRCVGFLNMDPSLRWGDIIKKGQLHFALALAPGSASFRVDRKLLE